MDRSEILAKVRKIFEDEWDMEAEKITEDANFFDDLNADSLDMVDLVTEMESEFDISITDEEVEKIKTVGDAVDFIEKHLS